MHGNSHYDRTPGRASPKLAPAFEALLEAFDYAADTGTGPWEFAVSIQFLLELGLNDNDLRWLVRKCYVQHAREVTVQGVNGREFQPTGDLTFTRRTCFVLTEAGVAYSRPSPSHPSTLPDYVNGRGHVLGLGDDNHDNGHAHHNSHRDSAVPAVRSNVPRWDPEVRMLFLGDRVVKRFKWQAANQEIILCTFQEEGWPPRIEDPLPPQPDQDSKRRLSDTIKCLNRKQALELIHFRGDGTGEGVIWEPTPQRIR